MRMPRMQRYHLVAAAIYLMLASSGCVKRINSCPEAVMYTPETWRSLVVYTWGDRDIQNWIMIHSENIDDLVREHPEYSYLAVPGSIYDKMIKTFEPKPDDEIFLDQTLRLFENLDRRNRNKWIN